MAKNWNSVKYCSERCEEIKIKMKTINLIFPHQLFQESVLIENEYDVYLIEEYLFLSSILFINKRLLFTEQV